MVEQNGWLPQGMLVVFLVPLASVLGHAVAPCTGRGAGLLHVRSRLHPALPSRCLPQRESAAL